MILKGYFILFIFQPIVEYIIHKYCHKSSLYYHKLHHIEIHQNNYKNSIKNIISIQILLSPIMYFKVGVWFWICFLKYNMIHMIIHIYPTVFTKLTKHHLLHHKNHNYNYSFTAVWPDILFNTLQI